MQTAQHLDTGSSFKLVRALMMAGVVSAISGGCAMTDSKSQYTEQVGHGATIHPLPLMIRSAKGADSYYAMGKYYFYQDRLSKAKDAFLEAIRLAPDHTDALNGLGAIYDRMGQHEAAERAYSAALLKNPKAAHVWANLGYSLILSGRGQDALEPLRHALMLDPSNEAARQNLARAQAAQPHIAAKVESPETKVRAEPGPVEGAPEMMASQSGAHAPREVSPVTLAAVAEPPQAAMQSKVASQVVTPAATKEEGPAVMTSAIEPAPLAVQAEQGKADVPQSIIASIVTSKGVVTMSEVVPLSILPTLEAPSSEAPAPIIASVATAEATQSGIQVAATPAQDPTPGAHAPMQIAVAPMSDVVPAAQLSTEPPAAGDVGTHAGDGKGEFLVSNALSQVRIEVSNGNGVTGMARAMSVEMRGTGLNIARITNARPFNKPTTLIYCSPEFKGKAEQLARVLPANPKVVLRDISHRRVDVRVVLGADTALAWRDSGRSPYRVALLSR